MWLTTAEVRRLTGKKTRPAQIRNLVERKIPHEVNGLGEVLVASAYIERRFGVVPEAPQPTHGLATEPDFTVFGMRA